MSVPEPVFFKPHWQVWTTDAMYSYPGMDRGARWAWVAHGPRGSQSGAEATSEAAVGKAYAAAHLLDDPERPGP